MCVCRSTCTGMPRRPAALRRLAAARLMSNVACTQHEVVRGDGQETTRLRCKPQDSNESDVWHSEGACVQQGERVVVLRLNAASEEGFAFIRTNDGVEGFIRSEYLPSAVPQPRPRSRSRSRGAAPAGLPSNPAASAVTSDSPAVDPSAPAAFSAAINALWSVSFGSVASAAGCA